MVQVILRDFILLCHLYLYVKFIFLFFFIPLTDSSDDKHTRTGLQ